MQKQEIISYFVIMPWGKEKSCNLVQSTNKQKKAPKRMDFIQKVILQERPVHLQGVHRQVQQVQQIHQKFWCEKTMF